RLNRQNGIAEDAGIHPVALCRLFKALQKAGYALRKYKRLYRNGKHWVTRVSIFIRPKFFHDLGLGLAYANTRTAKALSFLKRRRRAEAKLQQERLDETARAHERRMSHRQAESKRAEAARQSDAAQRVNLMRLRAERLLEIRQANPEKTDAECKAMYF
ncbi:hypothetical protein LU692_28320, partial [Pseudomonas sp. NMI795_08]|nr:hypothetical protein [Pseudomonas sp. NMI795_08]